MAQINSIKTNFGLVITCYVLGMVLLAASLKFVMDNSSTVYKETKPEAMNVTVSEVGTYKNCTILRFKEFAYDPSYTLDCRPLPSDEVIKVVVPERPVKK